MKGNMDIVVPPDRANPVKANAFRIVPDTGSDYFLDFMSFSPAMGRARVVARMRIHEECLGAIRDRLSRDLHEISPPQIIAPRPAMVN